MEQNELVVFENFSVLNQKAMSLPIGKVSIRQVLLITAGFLVATIFYLATTDLLYTVTSFVPFVVIAMINTKIVSLDQIIKSNISFLIRGTSLSKKYLNRKKSKDRNDSKVVSKKEDKDNNATPIKEKKPLFSFDGIASLIDLILLRKPKKKDENANADNNVLAKKTKRSNSVVLSVNHDENTVTLSNLQTIIEKDSKHEKKLLFSNKKNKKRIQDYLECTLDKTRLEDSDYIVKKGNLTIQLHKSKKYSIKANDEKIV